MIFTVRPSSVEVPALPLTADANVDKLLSFTWLSGASVSASVKREQGPAMCGAEAELRESRGLAGPELRCHLLIVIAVRVVCPVTGFWVS